MNILQINSSILAANSASNRLAAELVDGLLQRDPRATVTRRDLGADPVPHLDGAALQGLGKGLSQTLIEELQRADVIVIGLPMYNFGIPSQLKAWIDHVAVARLTFRYTDKGAEGLLRGKKAYVVAARGGRHAGTPGDTQTPYLRQLLGFLGITDVEFVYAEGLAMGAESRDTALQAARAQIAELFTVQLAA